MNHRTLKFVFIVSIIALIKSTNAFRISTFFERQPNDELIYVQTKYTIPTVEFELHRLEFNWHGLNQRFTQVELEMNEYNSASVYRLETDDTRFNAYIYVEKSKQLIVTLLVYGFNEATSSAQNKNDDKFSLNFQPLDRVNATGRNYFLTHV